MPCQAVISSGKEDVLSEKEYQIRFGTKIVVGYSEVVKPEDFSDFDEFFEQVQVEWDKTWEKVFSKTEGLLSMLGKRILVCGAFPFSLLSNLFFGSHIWELQTESPQGLYPQIVYTE